MELTQAVRFIAYYHTQSNHLPSNYPFFVALAHGYKDESGKPFTHVSETLRPHDEYAQIYAGYHNVVGDTVKIFEGGAYMLSINDSPKLNLAFEEFFNITPNARHSLIRALYPLILENTVPHVMLRF